ncbi:metalloregulator ArsR/SmtB family transcription factor [Sedimenticola thiotaurini]|uniref:HTH arsR-type domain-containing protein n=1 Tax=Sedimenticola thiotaurini TaxID=1543721 RepID=A0A0F7K1D4_9GAMM|nr:metalloregulator ArsR/SmtB family transcription factor [Sedimenticola thiotaurini]AKH20758.1 hypothetical protein AAY24_10810 [Sedimenticola thiotaurini]
MKISPHQLINAVHDQTRLRIIYLLNQYSELCVFDLVEGIDTNQPKVSRHLKVLRSAGIINNRRDGTWIYYRINPELPTWASRALNNLFDGCANYKPYTEDMQRLESILKRDY